MHIAEHICGVPRKIADAILQHSSWEVVHEEVAEKSWYRSCSARVCLTFGFELLGTHGCRRLTKTGRRLIFVFGCLTRVAWGNSSRSMANAVNLLV